MKPASSAGVLACLFAASAAWASDGAAVSLASLGSVQVVAAAHGPGVTVLPLNSPPIAGFIPQVVFGLTADQSGDDFDWYSHEYAPVFDTTLPSPASPKYLVATFDTGSQSHIITVSADAAFGLADANLEGDAEQTLIGANGFEYGIATDALGIYATGFQGVASTTGGNIGITAGSLKGMYNTSLIVLEDSHSALPNLVGAPMAAMYQTIISNSSTRHLTVGTNTYKSPDVHFTQQGSAIPGGYSRLTLSAVPAGGFTDPPSFLPNFTTFDHDNPQTATFWGSLLANVTVSHTGGTSSTQFLFDTGAEVSVLSEDTANSLGIFLQGPDATPPDFFVDIAGVGGTVLQKPGYYINQLKFTTTGGFFTYSNVPVVIVDLPDPRDPLHQTLPGLLGTNLFNDRDLILDTSGTPYVYFGPVLTPQWNTDASGNWSEDLKWTMGSPQEQDAPANFLGAITAPRTITVDGDYTVGSIKFDNANRYTINGPGRVTLSDYVGQASITVVSGSHTIAAPMTFANNTVISVQSALSTLTLSSDVTATGVAITKNGPGAVEMKQVRSASLSVAAGRLKVLANGTANSAAGTSVLGSLSITSGAVLDLTNNSMVIDYSGAVGSLVGDIRQHLQTGRLTSSSADASHRLGYGDNALLNKASFAGLSVDPTAVLIKYTWAGDANLDGQVDISDLGALATAWQTSSVWTSGDFDYSGVVDISDLGLLATNWQRGVGAPLGPSFDEALASVGLPLTTVPEPSMAALLAFALAATTARSRRRKE